MDSQSFICINCGANVESLYRKYSETVLKLTECKICNAVADKYVEYDVVVVIIDLTLLRLPAYRHILHNTEFKNYWKLSLILILLETYSNWLFFSHNSNKSTLNDSKTNNSLVFPSLHANKTEKSFPEVDILLENYKFFKLGLTILFKFLAFILLVFLFTVIFKRLQQQRHHIPLSKVAKTVTISSSAIFLLLPSLIWDVKVQYSFHIQIVSLYTTLSQLLAYTALCNCKKWCSLIVVLSAYFGQYYFIDFLFFLIK